MTPRLIAYGVITAALVGVAIFVWVTVSGWRADSLALPGVKMQLAATLAAEKTARYFRTERAKEIAADEKRLADVAAATPARPIRLCVNPVPAAGGAGG